MVARVFRGLESTLGDSDDRLNSEGGQASWFCVRTQSRREMFAQIALKNLNVESFFPRVRFRGTGRHKGHWITEPLFLNYLFCRFDLRHQSRAVRYAPGILGLIHFGNHYPVVPFELIQEMKATFGVEEPVTVTQSFRIGDQVVVGVGPLQGCEGVVHEVLPEKKRVGVLLEFLGHQTQVEMDQSLIQFSNRSSVLRLASLSGATGVA